MCAFNRNRLTAGLIVAAIESAAEAAPPGFSGHRTAPRAPEVMIYFTHSIGGGAGARSTFEIRAQQVSQISNSANPQSTGDTLRHDQWLSWKADTRADLHISAVQLKLGSRLTYDLTQARFALPGHVQEMRLVLRDIETSHLVAPSGVCPGDTQPPLGRDYARLPRVAQGAMENFDFGAATGPLADRRWRAQLSRNLDSVSR